MFILYIKRSILNFNRQHLLLLATRSAHIFCRDILVNFFWWLVKSVVVDTTGFVNRRRGNIVEKVVTRCMCYINDDVDVFFSRVTNKKISKTRGNNWYYHFADHFKEKTMSIVAFSLQTFSRCNSRYSTFSLTPLYAWTYMVWYE